MNFSPLLVLLSFFVLAESGVIPFKDCGSKIGKIKQVDIKGCTAEPCSLKKGTNATFTVDFTTGEVVNKLTAVVHGIVAGIKVPFPIPQTDACEKCGLVCPLKANTSFSYSTYIPVQKSYPTVTVPVEWELKSENGDDVFCMVVTVKIVD